MHNLYDVSKEITKPPTSQFTVFDDSCQPAEAIDRLLLSLNDPDPKKQLEGRQHSRYRLDKEAFALIRSISVAPLKISGKSMGGIACAVFNAKPLKLGKIDNISLGGLMFHHVNRRTLPNRSFVLDILLADCGFYLANLRFKIISELVIPDDVASDAIKIRQVRLQFQKPNTIQLARLRNFIDHHGAAIERRLTRGQ